MFPADFGYARARSLDEALDLLAAAQADGEEAKLLAGGQSLLPMMKLRLATPQTLIDIAGLTELTGVSNGDGTTIGALTTYRALARDPLAAGRLPAMTDALAVLADPQVRARGTIGGSLVHADPAADLPTAVLALGATLVVTGPSGPREVHADDFFTGFFESAVGPDEILTEVRISDQAGRAGWAYEKFVRRANDWAIVAAAVCGTRVALANMGPTPPRAKATEEALASGQSIAEAAALADAGTEPTQDMHASRDYRRHLARTLTRRALEAAAAR